MLPYKMNPLGISVSENIPLTFTAEQENSTVTLNKTGSPTVSGLHYRLGKSGLWLPYTPETTITLTNTGDSVQFWNSVDSLNLGNSHRVQFAMTGAISASGTIQSLLNFGKVCKSNSFYQLFGSCTSLLSAPELTAETIEGLGMANTFRGCGNMTGTVILQATTFTGESSCLAAFYATGISGIELKATQLATGCLAYAFYGSSSLSRVEVAFTEWLSGATTGWMTSTAAGGTFVKPAALPNSPGTSGIPSGWTIIDK